MTIDTRSQVPTRNQPFTLKQYFKDKVHAQAEDYVETGKSLGKDSLSELKSFGTSKTCGEALSQGCQGGFKVGRDVGQMLRVPLGIAVGAAALATGGIAAAAIYSLLGGFVIGSKTGEIVGRLSASHGTDQQQDHNGAVGTLTGGVLGAALTYGSPLGAIVGAFSAGQLLAQAGTSVAGAAVGGAISLVTHGVRKGVGALLHHFHHKGENPQPAAEPA